MVKHAKIAVKKCLALRSFHLHPRPRRTVEPQNRGFRYGVHFHFDASPCRRSTSGLKTPELGFVESEFGAECWVLLTVFGILY